MKTTSAKYGSICKPEKPSKIHPYYFLRILSISFSLITGTNLVAQPGFTVYTDMGENNVSGGFFVKSAILGNYELGKYSVEAGFQNELKSNNDILFSGYTVNASRELLTRTVKLGLKGFCMWTRNSEFLRETNLGVLLNIRRKHFEMNLGTSFRTYAFTKRAIMYYEIDKDAVRIHENFNVIYSFSYFLKKSDDHWNIGLSVTNIDHFIINQETNPVICLCGLYKPTSRLSLFTESWYKTAGVPNLAINHFGIFFRTGIIWNFN